MSLGPLMISLRGTGLDPDERKWLTSPVVGGVILFARNFDSLEQLCALVGQIRAIRSPGLLIAVDQEGGRVQRFGAPFQPLPAPRLLGHLYDTNPGDATRHARTFAWLMAAELRACGIDLSFAPVVDLDLGLASVIGDRALHESADIVARLAVAFLEGARAAGMYASAKHFPSHAGAHADSHLAVAVDRRDYDELIDDLIPYRSLIAHGLRSVMVAHVVFPALDPRPAGYSHWWLRSQLRGELGFSGAIVSDDLSMAGAATVGDYPARVQAALDAGCDLVLLCNASEEIPAVLDRFRNFVRPASQHHLMRLRGEPAPDWKTLRESSAWKQARDLLQHLCDAPPLELEG